MSTYKLELPSSLSLVGIHAYSKEYVSWKSNAVSTLDSEDDDVALCGTELKHIGQICDYVKSQTGVFVSLMNCINTLYVMAETKNVIEEESIKSILMDIISPTEIHN